jgi:Carboxypeptidase regulatory-like domain
MKHLIRFLLTAFAIVVLATAASAQVTTGSLNGVVVDQQKQPVSGASVVAIHLPSGTTYEGKTRADGRFSIPGMRVGGPYTVTVAYELSGGGSGTAFEPQTQENVMVNLGVSTDLEFVVIPIAVAEAVTVTARSDTVFSSNRTGAATALTREDIATLPTVSQRMSDLVRLTPQYSGNMSFAGMDNRYNNITIDGSYFNNSFGLAGTPGERTGVAPISLETLEQVQVNVAPYDVRQGNFVGAGVNSVTRSGGNTFRGSYYYQFRNEGMAGDEAKGLPVIKGTYDFRNTGGWVSGPIVKNKAFFFFNFEDEANTFPATTFRANAGGEPVGGSVTRVLASDLDQLGSFLSSKYGYETGPYQGYDFETPARRYMAKGDYNINNANKVSFRYIQLDSSTDVLVSNSSSLGFGTRRTNTTGLNFSASNYSILENIKSGIGEWNSVIGSTMSNSLIAGYTTNDESRGYKGEMFPFVDILNAGTVYTSFGFEPFTPNNELRYNTLQIIDNFTKYGRNHSLTFGASFERYRSENVFFPGSQSVYVFNSLADFYASAAGLPVTTRRFQVRWNNIPGQEKPIQPLEVYYWGAYAQDEWTVASNFKVTAGIRFDVPNFKDTGYDNPAADALTWRDENGNAVQYNTGKLPDANVLWSPRVGFNWSPGTEAKTQVRGGTGVFTGKPAYVWISNQIGNTGMLTGFEQLDNTTLRPFSPNTDTYKPATVTGDPASSYELAVTDPKFKFPQVWRTNIALDQRIFWGMTGTVEYLYNKDVNGIYYINADLPAAQTSLVGADTRPRWTNNRIYSYVPDTIVLKNGNAGRSWNISASLAKTMRQAFFRTAYSYGEAKNTTDAGSIAYGSWTGNAIPGDPNNAPLAFSLNSPGHRFFIAGGYRFEYFKFGSTNVSAYYEARTLGNASYTYAFDLNGDGGTSNDLLYVPRNTSEMNFVTFASGGVTYTADQQAAAWDAYINQDDYLSKRRGQYAERGAVFLPLVKRLDLSVAQDVFFNLAGTKQRFEVRLDMLNFGNLLNHDWGVGQRMVNSQPITNLTIDSTGRPTYRMRVVNGQLMDHTFETTTSFPQDVYSFLVSIKYFFN